MEAKLVTASSAEWIARLNQAGVPCGPIYNMDQVFADPQVAQIGIAQPVTHPTLGEIHVVGQGVNLSRTPTSVRTAAPELGEHTEEVLQQYGVSREEFQDLRKRGVV
jgi:crotonobetainyl-CoA:carnitine CoA-transferase CaiB-like acyl-CoA transferase